MPEYRGLCVSCKNASNCTYLKDARQPIWQCAEFEGYPPQVGPVKKTNKDNSQQSDIPAGSKNKEKESNHYLGLCKNCENRETCTFPKPEGGVWHCEEYR